MPQQAIALSELRRVDFGVHDHEYDESDLALYALGVGTFSDKHAQFHTCMMHADAKHVRTAEAGHPYRSRTVFDMMISGSI